MKRTLLFTLLLVAVCFVTVRGQTETLTNSHIIEMTQVGLGKDLIIQKIKTTGSNFDVSVTGLIELKKGGVTDEVIAMMVEKAKTQSTVEKPLEKTNSSENVETKPLTPFDVLKSARTIALHKDSLNPSRQALEKELLKRKEWSKLNLTITQDRTNADLSVEIGFVHLTLITHRYVFRVYDTRSGMVIAAGETTSWGSLAKNLARNIAKSLEKVIESGQK